MSDWTEFDSLPPLLRRALAGAAFQYDAKQFYQRVREGFTVHSLVNYIRECDLQYALQHQVSALGNVKYTQASPTAVTKVMPLYR